MSGAVRRDRDRRAGHRRPHHRPGPALGSTHPAHPPPHRGAEPGRQRHRAHRRLRRGPARRRSTRPPRPGRRGRPPPTHRHRRATLALPGPNAHHSHSTVHITVEPDGLLEYLADATIICAGADHHTELRADIAAGARLPGGKP
ncbi:urease accessory protein UreD [Actinokineospora sp. NPDC004072]